MGEFVKARCQICNCVEQTEKLVHGKHNYWINYSFDCDSEGAINVLTCINCFKIYVGSIIASFRKRFNNHKSSLRKYDQGGRKLAGEHLYAHFFGLGHTGLSDIRVIIIDKINKENATQREAFWDYKLDTFVPKGLNVRNFDYLIHNNSYKLKDLIDRIDCILGKRACPETLKIIKIFTKKNSTSDIYIYIYIYI